MKKFVRFSLVLIGIVVIALLVLAIIEPTDITVTRSKLINAPKEMVFEQVSRFKNWPNWSPWHRLDSTMRITYSGIDGLPGSSYQWVGEKDKVGSGEMLNVAVSHK